jgi:hypothetical protein
MEVRTEVKQFIVEWVCEECKLGNMVPTGQANLVQPPMFEHVCQKCKAKKFFAKRYPGMVVQKLTDVVPVEEEKDE